MVWWFLILAVAILGSSIAAPTVRSQPATAKRARIGYLALHRPPLRVAVELEAGSADDAAIAAGVALAIEERDGKAGPWRVLAANQTRYPNTWQTDFPEPRAHTLLYGLKAPPRLPGPAGPLLAVSTA